MGVRHRSTHPNGTACFDDLTAELLPAATIEALANWADSLGVHPTRLAAVRVKHGAVKVLLNVRNDTVGRVGKHRRPLRVPEGTEGSRSRLVRQWHNLPGAEPPPLYVWAPLLAAANGTS